MSQPCCGPVFWLYVAVCVCLVMFAGLMSGLTLGLMSLSLVDLEVIAKAGKPEDRKNAMKILPVVKNQHLLLCTLLIGNSLAMEALPIFLNSLVPAWGAILLSVTLILAFGEIIPQSVCSRYGLSVGARTAWIVRVLLLVFFPITYPISKVLDWILGKGHYALLRRAELKTLVDMHGNEAGKGGELTHDETTIITGALDLTQKTAKDAMTPISDTFSLDINAKLDMQTMSLILTKGHSRVPIYSGNPTNIIGLILHLRKSGQQVLGLGSYGQQLVGFWIAAFKAPILRITHGACPRIWTANWAGSLGRKQRYLVSWTTTQASEFCWTAREQEGIVWKASKQCP
ncbi:DUF21 domain-containing protein [Dendrobium catenatum]|uniref:DUF21 domain-containing protein n=1 Tax=Dendrobium catenatum TaxID=906689 RepID=A0A2I0X7M5_9ASPA|nr:DUF21 domain-containing protein [Dendrobium catenatum]